MKRFLYVLAGWVLIASMQAQIFTPVHWNISLDETGTGEKAIVFAAAIDKGWHLYDMDLPFGGPISTSFTFETIRGAELVGKPVASVSPVSKYDDLFGMNVRWYAGAVTFRQQVKITNPKAFTLTGEVEYIACDDERCLPP